MSSEKSREEQIRKAIIDRIAEAAKEKESERKNQEIILDTVEAVSDMYELSKEEMDNIALDVLREYEEEEDSERTLLEKYKSEVSRFFKDKRNLAPGLTLVGLAMILSKLLLKWLAPIFLAGLGLYRIIAKKKYADGSVMVVAGFVLWFLLSWRFVDALLSLVMVIGFLFLAVGVLLLIVNKKNRPEF